MPAYHACSGSMLSLLKEQKVAVRFCFVGGSGCVSCIWFGTVAVVMFHPASAPSGLAAVHCVSFAQASTALLSSQASAPWHAVRISPCSYADRMSRAVDTLIKAGAMQLGLPLAITVSSYHTRMHSLLSSRGWYMIVRQVRLTARMQQC